MEKKFSLAVVKVGMLQENCYLLMNNETGDMVIVDPGDEPERIIDGIDSMGGKPCAVFITHAHHDHIQALREIKEKYPGIRVMIGKNETELMNMETGQWFGKPVNIIGEPSDPVDEGDIIDILGTKVKVMYTPGHTSGGVCYYFPEEKMIFTGDTLFKGTCGRTDFPTGSSSQMMKSLKRLADELSDDTAVYPGHEDISSIGYERKFNPFMNRT